MTTANPTEPEGASPRELRRHERKTVNSEAFPEFAEPILATPDEVDEIIDLRPRRSVQEPKAKPNMRVDASMLRGSGLLQSLPEFLGQLARANLETETMLATNPDAVRFELDEANAEHEPHIELNLFAGVAETQRRRHARRIILPGGRPFKLPGDEEQMEDDSETEDEARDGEQSDSGDESDASTSTTASLRVRSKKRKAGAVSEDDDDESQPNKIRIQYQHPTPVLAAFDMSRGEIIKRLNPDASTESDPFVQLSRKRVEKQAATSSPTSSSTSSSSNSPTSSKKIIKIKMVNKSSSSSSGNSSAASSSRDSSRASTPEYKIIRVPAPKSCSSAPSSSASSTQSSPRIKIIRRDIRSVSPTLSLSNKRELARPLSSGSDSSSSSSSGSSASSGSSGSGIKKIKVINKPQGGYSGRLILKP